MCRSVVKFSHLKLSLHYETMLFRRLIFGKIIKIAAISQIVRLKYTKFYFGWGSAPDGPDPAGELTTAGELNPRLSRSLLLRERLDEREGKVREGREGRNAEFHHLLLSNLTTGADAIRYWCLRVCITSWPLRKHQ